MTRWLMLTLLLVLEWTGSEAMKKRTLRTSVWEDDEIANEPVHFTTSSIYQPSTIMPFVDISTSNEFLEWFAVTLGDMIVRLAPAYNPRCSVNTSPPHRCRLSCSTSVTSYACILCQRWKLTANGGTSSLSVVNLQRALSLTIFSVFALLSPDSKKSLEDVFDPVTLEELRRDYALVGVGPGYVPESDGGGGGLGMQAFCGKQLIFTLGGGGGFGYSRTGSWGFGQGAGVQTPQWTIGGGLGGGGTIRSFSSGYALDAQSSQKRDGGGFADIVAVRNRIRQCIMDGTFHMEGGGGGSSDADAKTDGGIRIAFQYVTC